MTRTRLAGVALSALLLTVGGGAVMAQTPEPVERTPEMESQAAELEASFPAELMGVSLLDELSIDVGQELLADLDPSDPDEAEDIAEIQGLMDAAGATIDDAAAAVAFVALEDETYAFLVAYEIRGSDASETLPFFVAAFEEDMESSRVEQGQIADQDVTLLYSDADVEADPLILWPDGDTTWIVSASGAFVEEAVRTITGS